MTNLRINLQVHSRRYIALGLILISLFAAMTIASESNRTVHIWAAKHALVPGEILTVNDLQVNKVLLPENSSRYLDASAKIESSFVVRAVGSGELIPVAALTRSEQSARLRGVPIAINRNDLPADLSVGESINIYSLPIKNQSSAATPVTEIAHGVSVASIDNASKSLGGSIGIVVRLSDADVAALLTADALNRLVAVRNVQ